MIILTEEQKNIIVESKDVRKEVKLDKIKILVVWIELSQDNKQLFN